jgi:hypothetical protein
MHEFTGDDRAWVYDYPAAPSGLGSWGMAGGGVQVMAANLTAFANFQAFIGDEIDGFAGQGGLRWSF